MQSLTVVLLQGDARIAESLISALSRGFSHVQQVQSLGEVRNRIAKHRSEVAILDIEAASLPEVKRLSQDFPGVRIVCTHRIADEEMWTAAMQAGATDVCPANDTACIVRAALGSLQSHSTAA
jgi:DNA-binding NtrC family response regulator